MLFIIIIIIIIIKNVNVIINLYIIYRHLCQRESLVLRYIFHAICPPGETLEQGNVGRLSWNKIGVVADKGV